jgi:UDPglucose 6-dehydrogenase
MSFRIIEAVLAANEETKRRMADKIEQALGGSVAGRTLALLGLSFKPDTDDVRESPAIDVARELLARGARLRAFDPEAMEAARGDLPEVTMAADAYDAADGADALVVLTEWNQFRKLELERLATLLAEPLIVDLRNIYEPAKIVAAGFRYVSLGRGEAAGGPGTAGGEAAGRRDDGRPRLVARGERAS